MAKAKLSSTKNSKRDIELIQGKFESEGYICNNQIATAIFLSPCPPTFIVGSR